MNTTMAKPASKKEYSPTSLDSDLIDGCIQQNSFAQEVLYKRWSGKLLVIPLRYTSSRQESVEILNSAFLKIFNSLERFEEISTGSFSGWMAKIVLNTTIDHVRKHTKYKEKFVFKDQTDGAINSEIISELAVEDILKLIQLLPSASKTIFNLFVIEGYKHVEISKMLKISASTSRWHLSEARRMMRGLINKHFYNN